MLVGASWVGRDFPISQFPNFPIIPNNEVSPSRLIFYLAIVYLGSKLISWPNSGFKNQNRKEAIYSSAFFAFVTVVVRFFILFWWILRYLVIPSR